MKQILKKRRFLVGMMILSLLLGSMCEIGPKAKAATRDAAVSWATSQIGKGLDYDGVYGNQCVDLIKYYYAYFGVAGYAMGNANAYITNSLPSGWTRVYSNYQPGDIAVWKVNHSCSTCNTSSLGHVGIITSADSVGFNAVNQNFNNQSYCTQNWFYCSALACAIRPSYTSSTPVAPSTANISFADFNQNGVWNNNAEMYIKVMNPGKATVSKVGCYLYNEAGTLVKSYTEDCKLSTSYVNYNCNINNDMKYTLTPGTTYKFVFFAIVNGTEYKDTMRSFTTTGSSDQQSPTITDVSVYNITEIGYDVRCKATDNVGVVRVQFPTWTDVNGQDDIQHDWGTNTKTSGRLGSDGYYVYHVDISDHNNELGLYHTHIYAYDKAGNSVCVAAPDVMLKKTEVNGGVRTEEPVVSTPKATTRPTQKSETTTSNTRTTSSVTKKTKVGKPRVTSLKAKKKAFTIKFSKASNAERYQVQYSTSSRFVSSKSIYALSRSVKVKKLKKRKKYFVRVRACNGSKCGDWSAVKKVKTK